MQARAWRFGRLGDVALGVLVLVVGVALGPFGSVDHPLSLLLVSVLAAAAAGTARPRPAVALGLVWAAAVVQTATGTLVLGVVLAVLVVAYGTARHGSVATVWAAGVSIPLGAVAAIVYAFVRPEAFRQAASAVDLLRASGFSVTAGFLVIVAVPCVPYAFGLLFRLDERNRRVSGERDAARAQAALERELAELHVRRTTLARDVHDIVGHSLAVIIAQADAAQLATDNATVHASLAQIAAVGRSSLSEVRDVLSSTGEATGPGPAGEPRPRAGADLDELVEGVRSVGHTVHDTQSGRPRPLPAAAGAAAHRVLQELLTNCLKHGRPGAPIEVTRAWEESRLVLRVANVPADPDDSIPDGMGLAGVRARLDAIGGTLQVTVEDDPGHGPRFVAVACLPLLADLPAGRREKT